MLNSDYKFLKIKNYIEEKSQNLKKINKREFLFRNKTFILIFLLFLIFGIGYIFGNFKTSKEALIKEFQISLIQGNARKLKNIVEVENKEVSKEELEPLVNYYKGKESLVDSLISDLEESKSNILKIKEEEGFWGDKYKIEINTFNLKVLAKDKNEKIYLNDKEIESNKEILNLIPGEYKIKSILPSEYGDFAKEKNIVLMENEVVDSGINPNYITIHSNFQNSKVYINGNDSGKTVKDFKEIGPFPTDGSVKIQIEENLPWGNTKSEEVPIYNKPDINIDINLKNDVVLNEIQTTVQNFYNSVFKALNEENKEVIDSATEKAKDKIYSILEQKYFFLKNKYNMIGLQIDKNKSTIEYQDGKYKASIVCDINYEVSKVFLGLGKENKNTKFFTKMIYENNRWVVSDIQNFSL